MIESKKGGRGKCQYCGKLYNHVSYHEDYDCKKSPYFELEEARGTNYIKKEKVLEILDKYRNSVGVKYAIEEIEKL